MTIDICSFPLISSIDQSFSPLICTYMDLEIDLPKVPSEIIWFQILTRLPAKSLMRFKCVCKFWSSSLFRDPSFVKAHQNMHRNQNSTTTHLLLGDRSETTQQRVLFSMQLKHELGFVNSPTPLEAAIDVLLSHNTQMTSSILPWEETSRSFGVNGLICLKDSGVPVRVFNPCTREFTTLPVSQSRGSDVFTTSDIGYNPLTNEYKVLQMHGKYEKFASRYFYKFEIFTMGSTSKSWREVPQISFDEESHCVDDKTLCIHGAIHWAVKKSRETQTTILAFDVGEERFRDIQLPDQECETGFYKMIEVDGCLAIYEVDFDYRRDKISIGIWILKDYQKQVWVKESIVFPDERKKLGWPVPVCTIHTCRRAAALQFGG